MKSRKSSISRKLALTLGLLTSTFILFNLLSCRSASTPLDLEFDNAPVVSPLIDGYWVLQEDLVFTMKRRCEPCNAEVKLIVPAGFVNDLASIPFPASILFHETGRYAAAGIVHDYLYWAQPCSNRLTADRIIKEALKAADRKDGTSNKPRRYLSRNTIKVGVFIGGWWPWKKNRDRVSAGELRFVKKKYFDDLKPGVRWDRLENSKKGQLPETPVERLSKTTRSAKAGEPSYCAIFAANDLKDTPTAGACNEKYTEECRKSRPPSRNLVDLARSFFGDLDKP